uniref:Choline dehydrogenase, mitochondrial n=1 Tax=Ciona intestinalis TaxID=7719 RepID=F6U1X0_CIOIN
VYIALVAFFIYGILKKHTSIARDHIDATYDFIIVGGGTTGAVVASRLSESNVKVLLIEAGDEDNFEPLVSVPLLSALNQFTNRDWSYMTEPQSNACHHMENNVLPWPRGKILGGTSSINTLLYARGCPEDFDSWKESGADGWAYDDVFPYFIKSEHMISPRLAESPYHGNKGKLFINEKKLNPVGKSFLKAGEELGFEVLDDYNSDKCSGFSTFQETTNKGYRQNSATAYLRQHAWERQENLHIIVRSHVQKVLFNQKKIATAVELLKNGQKIIVNATKEIILSAGVIGTPQLLMLSGVGPLTELKRNKINVVSHLPGVGQNLQDHVMTGTFFYGKNISDWVLTPKSHNLQILLSAYNYLVHGTGPIGHTMMDAFASVKWNDSSLPQSQLMLLAMETDTFAFKNFFAKGANYKTKVFEEAYAEAEKERNKIMFSFAIINNVLHPKSVGSIRLNPFDPNGHPLIDPKYLTDQRDADILIKGIGLELVDKIMKTEAFKELQVNQVYFHHSCDNIKGYDWFNKKRLECMVRSDTFTTYHPCCTAKIGHDKMAVVDANLKVYGVKHLRVADASVFPHHISSPPQATCYMIGEKVSDHIQKEWHLIFII